MSGTNQEQQPDSQLFEIEPSLGKIFETSARIMRQHYSEVLPIFAVFGLLNAVVVEGISYFMPRANVPSSIQNLSSAQVPGLRATIVNEVLFIGLSLFLSLFILYFSAGIGISKMNASQSHRKQVNYVNLAVTTLIVLILTLLASLFLLIPGLILATLFYLALAATVIEGKSPRESLSRSRSLVSRRWGKTFAVFIGTGLAVYFGSAAIGIALSSAFPAELQEMIYNVVKSFAEGLSFPFVAASMVTLYHSNQLKERTATPSLPPSSPYADIKSSPMNYAPASTRALEIKYCNLCGADIRVGEKYCHKCGQQLS